MHEVARQGGDYDCAVVAGAHKLTPKKLEREKEGGSFIIRHIEVTQIIYICLLFLSSALRLSIENLHIHVRRQSLITPNYVGAMEEN